MALCLVMRFLYSTHFGCTYTPLRLNFNSKLGLGHLNNVSVKEIHVDNPKLLLPYTKTHQPTTNSCPLDPHQIASYHSFVGCLQSPFLFVIDSLLWNPPKCEHKVSSSSGAMSSFSVKVTQWKTPCIAKPHHFFPPMRTFHHHLLHLAPLNPLSSLCMRSQCVLKELLYLIFYTSWSWSLLT